MYLTAYFSNNTLPAIGKNPTISVWTMAGSQIISDAIMTEIAGGFYAYNFTGYNFEEDYVFRAQDTSLPLGEQYVIASNEVDSQRNQGVIKQILGLVQGNFIMSGQTYDSEGRLLTSDIYTYDSASDATADTNRLFEYSIEADYDVDGNLIYYKAIKT